METAGISSAWAQQQTHQAKGGGGQDFASQLASNQLGASSSNSGVRSGGQLLSDDMTRALAAYSPPDAATK